MEKQKLDTERKDNEIIYSKSVKAGKRIYYLDVKKSRNEDLYLAITESKRKITGTDEDAQISYEKHKIFLYKEDFEHFTEGLTDVISFIQHELGTPIEPRPEWKPVENAPEAANDAEETEAEDTAEKPKSFFDKFKF